MTHKVKVVKPCDRKEVTQPRVLCLCEMTDLCPKHDIKRKLTQHVTRGHKVTSKAEALTLLGG